MARKLIVSDKMLQAIKSGDPRKRINDGAGLSLRLLLFAKGGSHGWRFADSLASLRNIISLGTWPDTGLASARRLAEDARALVAQGSTPARSAGPPGRPPSASVRPSSGPTRARPLPVRVVPLAPQSVAILRELRALSGSGLFELPTATSPKTRFMSENTVRSTLRRRGYGTDVMVVHGFLAMARTMAA